MATEQQVAAAVMTRIQAALGQRVKAYDHDQLPSKRPEEHVVVTIARRAGGVPRAGRYSTTGWAVYVMAASKTFVDNARTSLQKVRTELENKTLTVGDETSTPVTFRTGRPVGEDDGWLTGSDTFHFTI